jgi:hypothetical protein
LFEERRGISTFIATLLLMVLAVSAGVVIYAYTMGYLGGFGGADMLGAMSLDEASITGTAVTAHVRNIGKTSIEITSAYIDGTPATSVSSNPATIGEGAVGTVTIGGTFATGTTYQIKLIAKDNTQLSFTIKRP